MNAVLVTVKRLTRIYNWLIVVLGDVTLTVEESGLGVI
jgi:hypothetical protein